MLTPAGLVVELALLRLLRLLAVVVLLLIELLLMLVISLIIASMSLNYDPTARLRNSS